MLQASVCGSEIVVCEWKNVAVRGATLSVLSFDWLVVAERIEQVVCSTRQFGKKCFRCLGKNAWNFSQSDRMDPSTTLSNHNIYFFKQLHPNFTESF
jgi:hypothetical protein